MNKYQEALLKVINTFNDIQLGFEYSAKEFTICTTILKELVDKETPKKPIEINKTIQCPNCEFELYNEWIDYTFNYCPKCGQRIDWSDEKW